MSINLSPHDNCTGCKACGYACPKDAITFKKDAQGFGYPVIDHEKCIECGKCVKSCHVLTEVNKQTDRQYTYRYKASDEVRMTCSSGGFVPLLTKHCLDNGFYVAGVVFSDDFLSVEFTVTKSQETIYKMRKSKYVEADTNGVFVKIKQLLANGEKVLFVGVPCQVAALKTFLGKDFPELVTVDLICHGNGSPEIYKQSLASFCNRHNKSIDKIKDVDFRNKTAKYGDHGFGISFDDKSLSMSSNDFPYYYGFTQRYILRQSCYSCSYSQINRVGDFTVGDSTFSQSYIGESIVMANTSLAKSIMSVLLQENTFETLSDEEYTVLEKRFLKKHNPKQRKAILKIKSYPKLEKTYLSPNYVPLKYKIKRFIKSIRSK